MTEEAWPACTDPAAMTDYLRDKTSDRKVRLLTCALCRLLVDRMTDERSVQAVAAAELFADGLINRRDLNPIWWNAHQPMLEAVRSVPRSRSQVYGLAYEAAGFSPRFSPAGVPLDRRILVAALRDIFGNPFRPVACDPAWHASDVLALALGIYQDRAFDRMPILADALQDAGCGNDDVLNHCRGPGLHVRGCWVIDLVLGKV